MSLDDFRTVLYRNPPGDWVAEIPALPGCHALMDTTEEALPELANVFELIAEEYSERGEPLPADSSLVHAWRTSRRVQTRRRQARFRLARANEAVTNDGSTRMGVRQPSRCTVVQNSARHTSGVLILRWFHFGGLSSPWQKWHGPRCERHGASCEAQRSLLD